MFDGRLPVQNDKRLVHIGEAKVEGGGGEDIVAGHHAAGHLGHVVEATKVFEIDVSNATAAQLLN